MFTVNGARCTNQLETANRQRMNKWLLHQNGLTRTSLSAAVTGVSNFVEKNVCVWCIFTSSRLIQSLTAQHNRLNMNVNRNSLSMCKALNKGCK